MAVVITKMTYNYTVRKFLALLLISSTYPDSAIHSVLSSAP